MVGYLPWRYLGEEDLQRIKVYQFKAGAPTCLENAMNIFWSQLILYVPKTIAPNVLTFIGLLASLSGFIIMMISSSDLTTSPTRFSCMMMALGVFFHQTFDALDGKQARRIQEGSPLGALFDHGCDVLTLAFFSISSVALLCSGLTFQSILAITLSGQVSQFLYMWWEYHFKVFCSNPGFGAGVTEAQCAIIILALVTSVTGSHIWLKDIRFFVPTALEKAWTFTLLPKYLPLNTCFITWTLIINLFAHAKMLYYAKQSIAAHRKFVAFSQLFAFLIFVLGEIMFFLNVIERLKYFPLPGFLITIFVYSILMIRLLLSATSQKPYSVIQKPALPFMALVTYLVCDSFFLLKTCRFVLWRRFSQWFNSNFMLILWGFGSGYLVFFLIMTIYTIHQLSDVLHIRFFRVNHSTSRSIKKE